MLVEQIKEGDHIISETYKSGNTTVIIVAPPPMTEEEVQEKIDDIQAVILKLAREICTKEG